VNSVAFKFDVGEKVETIFDEVGVIEMQGRDETPYNKYFVKGKIQNSWFKEEELSSVN
jgi:hypothetical protein